MKTFRILFLLSVIFPLTMSSQISSYKPKVVVKKDSIAQAPYDSLYTFSRNRIHSLIGQEIQFLPSENAKREGRYLWFNLYQKTNGFMFVYEPGTASTARNTRYEILVNKTFKVVGVDSIVDDNRYFRKVDYRLSVFSSELPDTMLLTLPILHDSKSNGKLESNSDFDPFDFRNLIVLGYYEKLRKRLVNTTVSVRYPNNKMPNGEIILYNLETGEPISTVTKGKKFTVKDIGSVDGMEYGGLCYILSSTNFPDCYAFLDPLQFNNAIPITKSQKEQQQWEHKMILTYGKVNGNLIIQGKVKIGFTKQMCKEAWGEPESINTSTGSLGTHEQWVYGLGSYLYFENGSLTSIDN